MNKNPFTSSAASGGMSAFLDEPVQMNVHVPASASIYEEIRSRIISLALPPDTTLVRAELAEHFNVSQSPVREAIQRLEQDGLVVSYPQSRTVVTKIEVVRIREEHFLRSAVECEVVRQLATSAKPGTILKVKGILKMQEALVGDIEQIALFKQLDEAFHEALFLGVNQASLHQHIAARCGHLARLRTLDLPRKGKMVSVLDGHKAIVEAIAAGDGDKAAAMMRQHLSGTMERLPEIVAENQDLFA